MKQVDAIYRSYDGKNTQDAHHEQKFTAHPPSLQLSTLIILIILIGLRLLIFLLFAGLMR